MVSADFHPHPNPLPSRERERDCHAALAMAKWVPARGKWFQSGGGTDGYAPTGRSRRARLALPIQCAPHTAQMDAKDSAADKMKACT